MMAAPEYLHLGLVASGLLFWGGIVVFLATIAIVAIVSVHEKNRQRAVIGPVVIMTVGALIFCGGAAWYFWPKSLVETASISDHEKFHRMIITVKLREEYLKTQSTPLPMIQAGLETPPPDWFNKRLRELGEDWHIQTELKQSSEPGLFVECHLARFPLKVPLGGQVYALNLNALPLENGGGGIAEYSAQPDSEMNLGPQITTGQRCIVTNHGSKPLVNVAIGLSLLFQEQIKDKDNPSASWSGGTVLERPWRVDIRKIDPSPGAQFEFYIWNMTPHFANVSFLGKATAEFIGSPERFEFHVSSSNPCLMAPQ